MKYDLTSLIALVDEMQENIMNELFFIGLNAINEGISLGARLAYQQHQQQKYQEIKRKLAENLDDSSDEDDLGMDESEFNIFVDDFKDISDHSEERDYAMFAQYLGNSLFHTKPVQARYRELKREHLYYNDIDKLFYAFEQMLREQIQEMVMSIFVLNTTRSINNKHREIEFINAVRQEFESYINLELVEFTDKIIDQHKLEIRKIFKQFWRNNEIAKKQENLRVIIKNVHNFLCEKLRDFLKNKNDEYSEHTFKEAEGFSMSDNDIKGAFLDLYIESIVSSIYDLIKNEKFQIVLTAYDYIEVKQDTINKVIEMEHAAPVLKNQLKTKHSSLFFYNEDKLIDNIIQRVVVRLNTVIEERERKKDIKKIVNEAGINSLICKYCIEQDSKTNGLLIKEETKDQKVFYRIKPRCDYKSMQQDHHITLTSWMLKNKQEFRKYIPYTFEDIEQEIVENFDKVFYSCQYERNNNLNESDQEKWLNSFNSIHEKIFKPIELTMLKKIKRPVLAKSFTFTPTNAVDFIAYLRLSNRSMQRIIRNERGLLNPTTVFQCQFPCVSQPVIEIHEVTTSGNHARKDVVKKLNDYADIQDKIKTVEESMRTKLTCFPYNPNQLIVITIREIIQGKDNGKDDCKNELTIINKNKDNENIQFLQEEIIPFLANVAYLILGTESVRNPASFIINQMFLDLIEKEQLGWDALVNKEKKNQKERIVMPMAEEGSVARARSKHLLFRDDFKYSYFYSGEEKDTSNAKSLIKSEHIIVKKWKDNQKIHQPLSNAIDSWYGNKLLRP